MYVLGLMWCPALAAVLTLRLNGRSISELGWKWGATKYQLESWFIAVRVIKKAPARYRAEGERRRRRADQ